MNILATRIFSGLNSKGREIWVNLRGTSEGLLSVNLEGSGPMTQGRGRWFKLDGTGAVKIAEWAAGSNITFITLLAMPAVGAVTTGDEYVVFTPDPEDAVAAGTILTQVESLQNDVNWEPLVLGKKESKNLSSALKNGVFGGGSLAAKTVGGVAINLWVEGK